MPGGCGGKKATFAQRWTSPRSQAKPGPSSQRKNTRAPPLALALEITGHVHHAADFVAASRGKVEVITQAAAEHWSIGVFCVLSTDSEMVLSQLAHAVSRFAEEVQPLATTVNCTVDPLSASIYADDTTPRQLRPEHRVYHPEYPYPRRNNKLGPGRAQWLGRVQNTLSMFDKLWRVSELRRSSSKRRYDVVWRSRSDATATVPLATMRSIAGSRTEYIVPSEPFVAKGVHTDMEAILPTRAADRYDAAWRTLAQLYAGGFAFHPEAIVVENMRSGGFTYKTSDALHLKCWQMASPKWPCQ